MAKFSRFARLNECPRKSLQMKREIFPSQEKVPLQEMVFTRSRLSETLLPPTNSVTRAKKIGRANFCGNRRAKGTFAAKKSSKLSRDAPISAVFRGLRLDRENEERSLLECADYCESYLSFFFAVLHCLDLFLTFYHFQELFRP